MQAVLNQVKKQVTPSSVVERSLNKQAKEFVTKLNKSLKVGKAIIGGSTAKGTWLTASEVDVFVLFPYTKYKAKTHNLSDLLQPTLKKLFPKLTRLHGSRDYFQVKQQNIIFEIVPILHIKKADDAQNITDVSPLHAIYVNKHKKITQEIRLTKQFMKAQRIYGAESYLQGFSGYVCEVLTIHYGSFAKLIRAVAKWTDKTILDPEKLHGPANILHRINASKLISPLVLIDPVQKERNAAAAIGKQCYDTLISTAQQFVKKPSAAYFNKQEYKHKQKKNSISVQFNPKKGKQDIVFCKLKKALDMLVQRLGYYGFEKTTYHAWWDSPVVVEFTTKSATLSSTHVVQGPPVSRKEFARAFKQKHKAAKKKGKNLVATEKRKFTSLKKTVQSILKEKYLKDRMTSAKLL